MKDPRQIEKIISSLNEIEQDPTEVLFKHIMRTKRHFQEVMAEIISINGELERLGKNQGLTRAQIIALVRSLIPQVQDGHTPTRSELLALIRPLIPEVQQPEQISDNKLRSLIIPLIPEALSRQEIVEIVEAYLPEAQEISEDLTGQQIVDRINGLDPNDNDEKIDAKHIKNLPKSGPTFIQNGGITGVNIYEESTLIGRARNIRFIGSNITAVQNGNYVDVTVSGSGSLTIEEPTGTVDDSNTAFVFTAEPKIVVVNGASYRKNHGWSWNLGLLTATLDNAPQTGGDVYGIM